VQSIVFGARTSIAQGLPRCHPLATSCFAAPASASGTDVQMSTRPSPSKSVP